MFAFFRYDGHFSCLGAKVVGEVLSGGRVEVEGYGGMTIQRYQPSARISGSMA